MKIVELLKMLNSIVSERAIKLWAETINTTVLWIILQPKQEKNKVSKSSI